MNTTAFNFPKPLKKTEFYSFLAAGLLGVLFHFIYEWSGNKLIVGFFSPVSESTWEHLKLVFFPILLVSVAEYIIGNFQNSCFFCVKLKSALLSMVSVIVLFYTYSGILGQNIDWVNITIYFISMAIAYLYSYKKLSTNSTACNFTFCIIGTTILIIIFMIFSVYPPGIGLFQAP